MERSLYRVYLIGKRFVSSLLNWKEICIESTSLERDLYRVYLIGKRFVSSLLNWKEICIEST